MGCGCLSAGLHACTTAPITDRRQLKLIPESKLNAQAAQLYEKVKKKAKLSEDKDSLNKIILIGNKIENSISEYFYKNNISMNFHTLFHFFLYFVYTFGLFSNMFIVFLFIFCLLLFI